VREGVNGFLEEVGDFAAFTERLLTLAADRGRLAEMSRAAWETGQDYSVERMTERYTAAFAESAGAAPARRGTGFPVMRSCVSRYPFWLRKLKRRVLVAAGRGDY
jgi:hypothetical protein